MKNKILPYSLIFAMVIMVACTNKPYTENDNGKTLELSLDSEFGVELAGDAENYEWRVVGLEKDVLEMIGQPEIISATETSSGADNFVFTFKVAAAGDATLRIIYFDKQIEDPVPEKVFEMKIVAGLMGQIEE